MNVLKKIDYSNKLVDQQIILNTKKHINETILKFTRHLERRRETVYYMRISVLVQSG